MIQEKCQVEGCELLENVKGLCFKHYQALRRGRVAEVEGKLVAQPVSDEIIMRESFGKFADWVYLEKTAELINLVDGRRLTLWLAKQRWDGIARVIKREKIRICHQTVFEPKEGQFVGNNLNLFTPRSEMQVEMGGGTKQLTDYNEELLRNLGGTHYEFLLDWISYGIQFPGEFTTSLVLHGVPGSGKSTLGRLLSHIYGPYAYTVVGAGIESEFNAWLEGRLLIVAEEVTAGAHRDRVKVMNRLKAWVVPGQIEINRKGVNQYQIVNKAHWLFFSNDRHPLDIEEDDRRYNVIFCQKKIRDGFGGELSDPKEMAKNARNLVEFAFGRNLENFNQYQPLQNDDRKLVQEQLKQQGRVMHLR